MEKEKKQFTSKQTEMLYDLIEKYGGDDKVNFKREIKSFILYDRMTYKSRISAALNNAIKSVF